ncbi:MAG: GNAT family N-acetyltransferase [Candidatus Spyradocola sp.]
MTKEEFSRAYRAAMGWEAAVVHDDELPIEYPVCRYVFADGKIVTAVCPDIPLDAVPEGASLSDALDALFDMEQITAQPERVLGFCATDDISGEELPDIRDEDALLALLDALSDRDRAMGEVTVSDDFTACVMRGGRMLAAAGAVRSEGELSDISLCVHPEERGQGLGRRVLCALIRKIRDAGCVPLYRAEERNVPSVRLARRVNLTQVFTMEGALLAFPED